MTVKSPDTDTSEVPDASIAYGSCETPFIMTRSVWLEPIMKEQGKMNLLPPMQLLARQ